MTPLLSMETDRTSCPVAKLITQECKIKSFNDSYITVLKNVLMCR